MRARTDESDEEETLRPRLPPGQQTSLEDSLEDQHLNEDELAVMT